MTKPNSSDPHSEPPADNVEELFLLHMRYKEAQQLISGIHQPILLTNPNTCWLVYAGFVDLFITPLVAGKASGNRIHLARFYPGQVLFGISPPQEANLAFLAVANSQTVLLELPTGRLQTLAREEEFQPIICQMIDHWVRVLSERLVNELPPKECTRLQADSEFMLHKTQSGCASREIVWVSHLKGHSQYIGNTRLPTLNGQASWPLSQRTWLSALDEEIHLQVNSTSRFLETDPGWVSLTNFNALVVTTLALQMEKNLNSYNQQIQAKQAAKQTLVHDAFKYLSASVEPRQNQPVTDHQPQPNLLLMACQIVGRESGIRIETPVTTELHNRQMHPVEAIARASHFRVRRVLLRDDWWKSDGGPLLGFLTENGTPVALYKQKGVTYYLYNPLDQTQQIVTPTLAETVAPHGFSFYRPFPAQALTMWELFKFGLRGHLFDLRAMLFVSLLLSLLGLIIPLVTSFIFDSVIPSGNQSQLIQMALALGVVALVSALFQASQNLLILRLQGKTSSVIQASVWDRLLNLPASFFRDYTAGDLGQRAMGIDTINQLLSTSTITAVLSGVFSVSNFFLMLSYDTHLAWVATLLVVIALGATLFAGYTQLQYQRQLVNAQGELSGLVLQIVSGITKFRAAGVEEHAFATWANRFARMRQTSTQARTTANRYAVFNGVFAIVTSITIYAVMIFALEQTLTVGTFLGFNAAFGQFLTAVLSLGSTAITILNVIPVYERAKPILQSLPEVDELKKHPGTLTGSIEISNLTFRYGPEDPLVLRDVNIEIKPGEFVAIVGSSGSGKSTLLRLLLGFEKPAAGMIRYNGHDLANLDMQALRRQIGVVLQDGSVLGGSIYENIVGSSHLTIDDAWEAARLAGLEEDVRKMPMQLHTVITAGGGTLSGGQYQRLLIARALARKPRILFLDEATSALDNQTQKKVSDSLENLQATRLVIAHRLSTIMKADKIVVLDKGTIVQSGTYSELLEQDGFFAELARRQMA